MPTVAILGTRYPDFSIEESVLAPLGVEIVSGDGADPEAILTVAGSADVILAGSRPRFDADVIAALACRGIVRAGIGVDSVDLDAARAHGRWVVNVPDYGTEAVSFHAVTLGLAGMRRVVQADRTLRAGGWGFAGLRPLHLPAASVAGVVGFGRIGRRAAELFVALGFGAVLAHDPFAPVAVPGVQAAGFEELLEQADVVTLHAPGPADGSALLGPAELASMKEGSVLVNTARGALVDTEALVVALSRGRPAVAALDVFSPEPPDVSAFADVADRLVLTPHMAWYTEESEADMRRKAAEEARRLLEGSEPLHPVVRPESGEDR